MKKLLLLLLLSITLSSCEKDDVCTEETTPRLVLEFFDSTNNATAKNVVNLVVKADGAATPIVFNSTLSETDATRYLFNGNILKLPLKIDDTTTRYSLILNSTSTTGGANEDFIQFDYAHQNVFVSRACGYKTTFTLNNPDGVTKTDATIPDSFWIQGINIITNNITSENETHIKIYF